jgi:hypothetical protein
MTKERGPRSKAPNPHSTNYPLSSLPDAAELEGLRDCYLKDLRADPRWKQLSAGARHVAEHLVLNMNNVGQFYRGSRERARRVPPMPTDPLTGGRPTGSDHISRTSLLKYEKELETAGLISFRDSSGKILPGGLRTSPIKFVVLVRSIWIHAWARFKARFERLRRGGLYQGRARAFVKKRVGRLAKEEGRYRSLPPPWVDADNCALTRAEHYVYTDEEGRELYRVIRYPGKRFKHEWANEVAEVHTG